MDEMRAANLTVTALEDIFRLTNSDGVLVRPEFILKVIKRIARKAIIQRDEILFGVCTREEFTKE